MNDVVNIEFIHKDYAKRDYDFFVSTRDSINPKERKIEIWDKPFNPYFYLPAETEIPAQVQPYILDIENKYTSLFKDSVKKVILKKVNKQEFMNIISFFKKTFEDDVLFLHRFIADNDISYTKNQRVCYFDIENNFSLDIVNAPKEVICIAWYDNFYNRYYISIYHPTLQKKIERDENITKFYFSNERDMIEQFVKYLKIAKVDIITGWNIIRFDLPYLMNRMKKIGMNSNTLSIFNKSFCIVDEKRDHNFIRIYGTSIIDLLSFYKKATGNNKPTNFRLGTVAKHLELELQKDKIDIQEAWNFNIPSLINYNLIDVKLLVEIDRKAKLLETLLYIQEMVPIPIDQTVMESRVIDQYILKKFHNIYVFPSKRNNEKTEYRGPKIETPGNGIFGKCVMFDFKSFYPSIYITLNISPETILSVATDIKINDLNISAKEPGILPIILQDWLMYRYKLKEEMKFATSYLEKTILDNRQGVVKMLLNSVYGTMAYSNFRLYNYHIPEAICTVARDGLEFMKELLQKDGIQTIYLHTDSCLAVVPEKWQEDIPGFIEYYEKKINDQIKNEFIKKYGNTRECIICVEGDRDKIFDNVLVDGTSSRYVARQKNKLLIKGYEFKKRDVPKQFRSLVNEIILMFLSNTSKLEIKTYLLDKKEESKKYPAYELATDKPINRFLDEYIKNTPQHIRAAKYSNQYLNTHFTRNNGGRMLFCKVTGKYPDTDVILIEESTTIPKEIEVNYDRIFDFFVYDKLLLLENVKDLNIREFILSLKNKNKNLAEFGINWKNPEVYKNEI